MDREDLEDICYCNFFEFIKKYKSNIYQIKQNYLNLLSNLTETPNLSTNLFINTLNEIELTGGLIVIGYIGEPGLDSDNFKIVGSGTILIEPKLIHGARYVGHIEDIVVNPNFRGKHIAQNILSMLKSYSIAKNCYKVILDCNLDLQTFYEKNGFELKGIQMSKYF